jgi:hypothetical protein
MEEWVTLGQHFVLKAAPRTFRRTGIVRLGICEQHDHILAATIVLGPL